MLIPSDGSGSNDSAASLSRRVNANSQPDLRIIMYAYKLIKKGEC